MAVIEFLPDRLNTPPVIWRGFTAGEFLLAAGVGFLLGIPVSIPLVFILAVGWIAIADYAHHRGVYWRALGQQLQTRKTG